MGNYIYRSVFIGVALLMGHWAFSQDINADKKISSDLFGLFFEDIKYAADVGFYS
jgi:hypothetical protein